MLIFIYPSDKKCIPNLEIIQPSFIMLLLDVFEK